MGKLAGHKGGSCDHRALRLYMVHLMTATGIVAVMKQHGDMTSHFKTASVSNKVAELPSLNWDYLYCLKSPLLRQCVFNYKVLCWFNTLPLCFFEEQFYMYMLLTLTFLFLLVY